MTPLAPLGGGKTARAPSASALAAFAKTRDVSDNVSPLATVSPVRPLPLAGNQGIAAALAPLQSATRTLGAVGDRNAARPLASALSSVVTKNAGEVSALAAFAKKAVLQAPASTTQRHALDRTPCGKNSKRPTKPLVLDGVRTAAGDESEPKITNDIAVEEQKKSHHAETDSHSGPKTEAEQEEHDASTPAETAQNKSQDDEKKTRDPPEGSDESDNDSMEAFACMDSSDDDDDGGSAKREAMAIDDLYEQCGDQDDDDTAFLRANQRIFVPTTSKHDLFHAILVEDVNLLTHTLSQLSPLDTLHIRDPEERTMYHYAALSTSPEIQAVVFDFVRFFLIQETDQQVAAIVAKQQRLTTWKAPSSPRRTAWVAPSIKQLHAAADRDSTEAYLAALRAYDRNGRSFLHYSALNRHVSPMHVSRELRKVLKSHCRELLHNDAFERDPLAYAVMANNTQAITLWFLQLGVGEVLVADDIDRLTQLKASAVTQRVLYKLLEDSDVTCTTDGQRPTGLSLHFLTKCPTSLLGSGATKSSSTPSASRTRMWTSLHKAAMYGNVDAVHYFLDQGASINERDADGWTPLHHCAADGSPTHLAVAQLLLDHGANVNAASQHGRTPLHLAAMRPCDEAVDKFSTTPLVHDSDSSVSSPVAFASLLCDHRAKLEVVDEDHCTPFLAAVRASNVHVTRYLLDAGCNPAAVDKTGGCALHIAVSLGLDDMIRFLCWWDAPSPSWRFAVDYHGRLPRALARGENDLRNCLDNLWYGACLGDVAQVRQQLQQYRSIDKKRDRARYVWIHDKTPRTHRTALHLAVEPLLDSSNQPGAMKSRLDGKTGRQAVTVQDAKQIVAALLQEGASVAAGDQWGISPLMLAASIESPLILEAMLQYATEEDLFHKDAAGNMAVHYSYAFRRVKISSLLEDAMGDAEATNNDGKSPLGVTGFRDKIFPRAYRDFLLRRSSSVSLKATAAVNPVRK